MASPLTEDGSKTFNLCRAPEESAFTYFSNEILGPLGIVKLHFLLQFGALCPFWWPWPGFGRGANMASINLVRKLTGQLGP